MLDLLGRATGGAFYPTAEGHSIIANETTEEFVSASVAVSKAVTPAQTLCLGHSGLVWVASAKPRKGRFIRWRLIK